MGLTGQDITDGGIFLLNVQMIGLLAGELGAGITLVAEIIPKEKLE